MMNIWPLCNKDATHSLSLNYIKGRCWEINSLLQVLCCLGREPENWEIDSITATIRNHRPRTSPENKNKRWISWQSRLNFRCQQNNGDAAIHGLRGLRQYMRWSLCLVKLSGDGCLLCERAIAIKRALAQTGASHSLLMIRSLWRCPK